MTSLQRLECRAKFFFLGKKKFHLQGVTYGPFRPNLNTPEIFLPAEDKIKRDLEIIRQLGANTLRLYHVPPRWFLDLLAENQLYALITVPWQQHLTFLDHRKMRHDIQHRIRRAAEQCANHPALMGLLIGNEIPSDMVRWYGAKKIRNFLDELIAIVKNQDANTLVSYAAYPTTEYLIPRFADFLTYNVYLHRQTDFQNYLARLQNLAEEKPLILGEFGMDTQRHTQTEQAEMLTWHIETVIRSGLAGTILFSFTDEWFTGGHDITDWDFGLVTRDRSAKLAYHAVQKLWKNSSSLVPLPQTPKVSIVVCSYNGGKTLKGALESLDQLSYPNYEIILVDDGSTDNSQQLVQEFETDRAQRANKPDFKNMVQPNLGLSAARNNGMHAATGEIIAYTDSDCIADREWIYYLVNTLLQGDFAAVGGPNISPPAHDWIQACVAAAPGSPSHVLISDTVAEHVPGCNMAYWKWALLEIDGFDIEYRKAGDDVDVCWRLIQRGYQIGFSPSAVVWHHRRFTVKAYFKQQSGYGEAEALLRFKHLIYFGTTGGAKWRGTVYGTPRFEHIFSGPIIYHGTFGMGLFQCIYPRQEAAWIGIVSSLEWMLFTLFIFLLSWKIEPLRLLPLIMLGLTLAASASWMARARLEPKHDSVLSRLLLLYLAFTQPWVRSWARYFTWLKHKCTPRKVIASKETSLQGKVIWITPSQQAFWNEQGKTRQTLLDKMLTLLEDEGWKYSIDVGWSNWDLLIFGNRWWHLKIKTANEFHGGPKVLTRVVYQPKLTAFSVIALIFILSLLLVIGEKSLYAFGGATLALIFLIYHGRRFQKRIAALTEAAAEQCQFTSLNKKDVNPKKS